MNQILQVILIISILGQTSHSIATKAHQGLKNEGKNERNGEFVKESEIAVLIKELERSHEIPEGLLAAIANIESGYRPYALNIGGRAVYADSLEEAADIVQENIAGGGSNVDVGVMQLNWRWHGKEFASVKEMLEPRANITYAAKLLRGLYEEHGRDWQKAVRYYHSRNALFYKDYSRKVMISWIVN